MATPGANSGLLADTAVGAAPDAVAAAADRDVDAAAVAAAGVSFEPEPNSPPKNEPRPPEPDAAACGAGGGHTGRSAGVCVTAATLAADAGAAETDAVLIDAAAGGGDGARAAMG